ncbi:MULTISPECIES: hypothetical protein [Chryseobacterium]|uniref:Leucine-rich repeat domain-containing protein n=1 Tax=Chryseobacterium camelliae TaxID=1265445 RepID=A0ABU0TFH9_9FLAO|nr:MULTISPECIES: hypothetical protein [Chryseobacterium]MDT3406384.1 hypothetical protein [Pseudacidovorax intermedius]MDQ1095816.1 hypothetical protein [Chryseobacterium camelliae]MDQ1099753.1 hypothetical protein [Chryseobacterium sp. SORGH_AS_1048]MDR6087101.1 hypothetical protein [Chryseobacterium sp. SORGH_AS_0909]MDR6131474.1 hypothetical protein [Chryseobacterium sp. SORGH_AS_1175]
MNIVEQYDANNSYYALDVLDTKGIHGLRFESEDNNIYITKVDFGDGVTRNGTGIIGSGSYVGTSSKTYSDYFTGKIKIYNNPQKIKKIVIDFGLDGHSSDPDYLTVKNVVLTPEILDYFPNADYFYFNHYSYGSIHSSLKGKVTGEWATKCRDKLKVLAFASSDYPTSDPTFDFDLIPTNSILENLTLPGYATTFRANFIVKGNISNIPNTLKIINLGGDNPANTTNSVSGVIPNWVTYFSRLGRNTITANVEGLNDNLQYLTVLGNNGLSGNLKSFPLCTTFNVQGNNTISGTLKPMPLCTSFSVMSSNCNISGLLNNDINLPNAETINVTGISMLSGVIKTSSKITTLNIAGNNQIEGLELLSNCTSFTLQGNNTISGNPFQYLPKARTIVIQGNNKVNNYTSRTYPTMSRFILQGLAELDQAKVDQLLKDLSEASWNPAGGVCTIKGNCSTPSATGKNYASIIASKGSGVIVSIN